MPLDAEKTGGSWRKSPGACVAESAKVLLHRRKVQSGEPPVLLNLLPIQTGGGLQNALSLVRVLPRLGAGVRPVVALVRRGSSLHDACHEMGIPTETVSGHACGRYIAEVASRWRFARGQLCFTLFGPPLLGAHDHLVNIVGCAYSNLFYPEVPFWNDTSALRRLQRISIDWYRARATAAADYWIFVTKALRRRAVEICGFPPNRVDVVPMSVSDLVSPRAVRSEAREHFNSVLPDGFRVLFLCGPHSNKRLHLLPAIASEIRASSATPIVLVTTLDPRSGPAGALQSAAAEAGVDDLLVNVGRVAPTDVASLIDAVQAMATFSVLESFSNNFVEAWRMGKPLVVPEAEWARDSCGGAAMYVQPADTAASAAALIGLASDAAMCRRLVAAGRAQLDRHPTAEAKIRLYLEHIERASALGPCPASERINIRWPVFAANRAINHG